MSDGILLPTMNKYEVRYTCNIEATLDIIDYYIITHSIKKLCKDTYFTEITYESSSDSYGIIKIGLCTLNDLCYLKLNKIHNRYDFTLEQ